MEILWLNNEVIHLEKSRVPRNYKWWLISLSVSVTLEMSFPEYQHWHSLELVRNASFGPHANHHKAAEQKLCR